MRARMWTLVAVLLALALSAAPTSAASIYMEVNGDIQGWIRGDATERGEEDMIEVDSFRSSVMVPYDQATGRPSGRNQYSPIALGKSRDRATIPLMQALLANERMDVQLRFYRPDPVDGTTQHYYTVHLENANLVELSEDVDISSNAQQSLGFLFQRVTWRDEINALETTDDWTDVVAALFPEGQQDQLALLPPEPNPSAGPTTFRFRLPSVRETHLDVYDVRGRKVATLFSGRPDRRNATVTWDGRDMDGEPVARGLYMVKLRWPEGEVTQRVTLVR